MTVPVPREEAVVGGAWRIDSIEHDRVLVTPAPGESGKVPFWKGDGVGRPVELGRAMGAFTREISELAGTIIDREREALAEALRQDRRAMPRTDGRPEEAKRENRPPPRPFDDRDPFALDLKAERLDGLGRDA